MTAAVPIAGEPAPILERAAEQGALEHLLEGTAAGAGGFAVIEAAAGCGKTTLLRDAIRRTGDTLEVLRATGSELESGFPLGIARQLFAARLRESESESENESDSGSENDSDPAAARLLRLGGEPAPATTDPWAAVTTLFALTEELAAATPLLIAVDDAHWADPASLRFLHYLARRAGDLPVALVVASRPPDAGHDPLVAALLAVEDAIVLRPGPLGVTALAVLARETLGAEPDPAFVQSCAQATDGNPFLVVELLRELAATGAEPSADGADAVATAAPDAVRRRTAAALAGLSAPAASVARALAILGEAELPLLAAQAGVPAATAADACRALEHAGILDRAARPRFTHPLIARAVAGTIAVGDVSAGHLRAAHLLEADGAALDAIAAHLYAIRPAASDWVAGLLCAAGHDALARGAPAEAIRYARRALAEPPPPEMRARLLVELGSALLRQHEIEDAVATLREAAAGDPPAEVRADLALALSQALFLSGDPDGAAEVLETSRELRADPARVAALEASVIALALTDPDRAAGHRARLERHRAEAQRDELTDPALLAMVGGEAVLAAEPAEPNLALVRRAFAAGLTPFDDHTYAFGWAVCALDAGDCAVEALTLLDRFLAAARPRGDSAITCYLLGYRTHMAMRAGRLAEAEADGRTAWEIYASSAGGTWLPLSYLDVLVERDRAQEAWELIGRDVLLGSAQRTATTELVRARVQIALGRGDGAVLDTLLATGRELDEMRFLHPQFMPWRAIAAQLAAELGESELARGLADEVLELGHRSECPTSISQGLRIHGGLHGDRDALAEAVQTAARTADRLEHARALTALGTAELEAGATAQARETLRAALATAHDAGALRLANQARAALIAAGGRPRRAALTGIDALTPSELQVARLAADGLTNRDIADTLFVAVKTVEQHLARAYSKLEIPGRAALTEALTR